MILRPYQAEAVGAVLTAFQSRRSALIVMPTGTGKTVVFAKVAERMRPRGRSLILAHREELIAQACDKIAAWTSLSTAVEMADERAATSDADVVVASVATLARASRLERFRPDAFGLVVIDEAHHAPATTYRRILDYFGAAYRLGVTATPDRLDGHALGAVFECAPFVYELRDAIEQGHLAPIRQRAVRVKGLDLSRVRMLGGDFNEGDLERVLSEEALLHEVAEPLVRFAGPRKVLTFAVTVAHARALAEVLGRYAGPDAVAVLDGSASRDERRGTLARFAAGEHRILVNCALFTEGFDLPAIDCVAVVRPTKSRALYAQMVGRGTRTAPGKADLLVLDFRGNAGRHTLVNAFDVLDGTSDEQVRHRAQALMDGDEALSMLDAVALANQEAADAEQRRLRRRLTVGVDAALVDVDPFAVLGVHVPAGRWGGVAMTERQREVLQRAGLPVQGFDRGQASGLIDAIVARSKTGVCTFKQAKVLLRFGYSPDLSFDQAGRVIDGLARNRWRRPRDDDAAGVGETASAVVGVDQGGVR